MFCYFLKKSAQENILRNIESYLGSSKAQERYFFLYLPLQNTFFVQHDVSDPNEKSNGTIEKELEI